MSYSLTAHAPLNSSSGQVGDITNQVSKWRRSTALVGGPWRGSFRLDGPKEELEDWFYNGIGRHIEEHSHGMLTWSGFVWEVDYVQPAAFTWFTSNKRGRRQRFSLESLTNEVKSVYTDPSTDPPTTGETAWQSDNKSKGFFGTKQEILYETLDSAAALNRAQDILAARALPFQETVGIENNAPEAYVEVVVAGYVNTAQWKYVTTDNGNQDDISDWITAILDTDIDNTKLIKGVVDSNLNDVYRYLPNARKAWEVLEDLGSLRGPSDERYYYEITPERVINYKQWDREPVGYFFNGRFVDLGYNNLEEVPRQIKPGVYRSLGFGDASYKVAQSDDSFLLSTQDFLLETIEVRENGTIVPRLGFWDQEESLRSFVFKRDDLPDDYQFWREHEAEGEGWVPWEWED
jgi:hypothetical protein